MNRRDAVLALSALAAGASLEVLAQPGGTPRIAFLSGGAKEESAPYAASFLEGMRALGYGEGRNFVFDVRYADYSAERARALAAEIAKDRPALIVTFGGGIRPATEASPPIPVVFIHSGDPVDAGFADSLARPGHNSTGISLLALDLIPKRIELLRQIVPQMRRVVFLASPEHAGQPRELAAFRAAADQLNLAVDYVQARTPTELAAVLPDVAAKKPDAALLFSDALMVGQRQALAAFFLRNRIPSATGWSAFTESGHLLSYGPERHAAWRRLAYFADRILKGARAGDLPIELPTVVEMAVNRRTAAAMGFVLPQDVLLRADRVIDTPVML